MAASSNRSLAGCVAELAELLSWPNVQREIRQMVLHLFSNKYIEFIQVALKDCGAELVLARESRELLEPSDLFLEVLAALRAADWDRIRAINHANS
jgi:hypothetical protein